MSKKPLVPEVLPDTDIQEWEMEKVRAFIEEGLPGIGSLTDDNLARSMELYLSGKSYREISQILNTPKVILLYLSNRYQWFKMKMEYLDELDRTMKNRLDESKLRSNEFLLKLSHSLQKKMSKKLDRYLATDKEEYLDSIDEKQVAKYLKIIEMLHRTDAPKAPAAGVNINMNMNGVTVSKGPDGSVDFTAKEKTVAAKLKEMAEAKRAEARAASSQTSDIKQDHPKGESGESN